MGSVRSGSTKACVALVAVAVLTPASAGATGTSERQNVHWPPALVGSAVSIGETEIVSLRNDGAQTLRRSLSPTVSARGRFVAFSTRAHITDRPAHLAYLQVYVRDMDTGVSRLVSRAQGGGGGNGSSNWPSISADGTRIVYESGANNLVVGDTNGYTDVFTYDTQTKTTSLISHRPDGGPANFASGKAYIAANGTSVVFTSTASNLVSESVGGRGQPNVYLYDIAAGTTKLVTDPAGDATTGDPSYAGSISANGDLVTFRSTATNLVPDDHNGRVEDVFLYNATTGQNQIISETPSGPGDAGSGESMISGNGNYVAYDSFANNLVAGDDNRRADVFVYDVAANSTTLISRGRDGLSANNDSYSPSISRDGERIAYTSYATNLVARPDYFTGDIYVFDSTTGSTRLISKAPDGSPADGGSDRAAISIDGTHVGFESRANNLVPGDNDAADYRPRDVFLHHLS